MLLNDISELDIDPLTDVGVTNNGFLPFDPSHKKMLEAQEEKQ
jgi:hypothetical protein